MIDIVRNSLFIHLSKFFMVLNVINHLLLTSKSEFISSFCISIWNLSKWVDKLPSYGRKTFCNFILSNDFNEVSQSINTSFKSKDNLSTVSVKSTKSIFSYREDCANTICISICLRSFGSRRKLNLRYSGMKSSPHTTQLMNIANIT